MIAQILAGAVVVAAQGQVPDRYQQFGQNIGETHNSIGAVLNSGNYDSQWISQAIAASGETIKQVRQEIANKDWPSLTTEADVKHHETNLRLYLAGLEQDEQNMRLLQSQVLAQEAVQPQTTALSPVHGAATVAPTATNALLLQNKAVIKEGQESTESPSITDSASSATATPTDKSESKESKKEEKSESKESKSASKSASKASKSMEKNHEAVITGNAKNSTNSTASASRSPSGSKHHKNAGAIAGVSSGAIFLAVMALL